MSQELGALIVFLRPLGPRLPTWPPPITPPPHYGSGAAGKPYVSLEQLRDFVNTRQRDPRLNEVLHPPLSPHSARLLVERYEPNRQFRDRGESGGGPKGVLKGS